MEGRTKWRDSEASAARGPGSKLASQPSGGVMGSTRCSVSRGKSTSIRVEKELVEEIVSS